LQEADSLVRRGVRELILVAQDTTSYGRDLRNGTDLESLSRVLAGIEDLRWIRWMYAHPAHLDEKFLHRMAEEEKVCRYLDLPLQHVSGELLKAMGREGSRRSLERLVETIRRRVPGVGLRTTFIVGFPGETDAMFRELLNFVQAVRFERLGAFVFSAEEGTKAFGLKPRIPKEVAEERYRILMETQQVVSREINRRLESATLPVLIDGYDPDQGLSFGRTEWDAFEVDQTVWVEVEVPVGEIVDARITASSAYDLMGVPSSLSRAKVVDRGKDAGLSRLPDTRMYSSRRR
jgi:ribosomal protein S12 methylthiotransferase